ncbi:MAG: recombinase family protein, partial [Dehalococcoidia bacterium]|nr:recombinase family protein [Dehalococcoidia bacterium]
MVTQTVELVTKEKIDEYVGQAAKAAGYEKGFGITGCDLSLPIWWAAYCRQSLDQQANNNRLPEYLLTMAKMARDQGIVVPREYVLYDHKTGEHLERPGMIFLRHELARKQKVVGMLFADLRCLSREPAPQQVFERECEILGIKLRFGDAPSGMDVGSQFTRSAMTFGNKLTRLATNKNARAGNIGRVLKGSVPAHKAAYGYSYHRDAEVTSNGRILVKKAWWEINGADSEDTLIKDSPAWVVSQIFQWIGGESRTSHWVAKHLNDMGITAPQGGLWAPNTVCHLVRRCCYTGKNVYNSKSMVP